MRTILTRREWLLISVHALLASLALPPLPLGPLGWVALIPLFMALEDTTPRHAMVLGLFAGFLHNIGALYWVGFHVAIPRPLAITAMLLAAVAVSLNTAFVGWAVRTSERWLGSAWPWALAPAWVTAEYSRLFTQFAFPWNTLAHTQVRFLGLIQQADLWGVFGVSFWLAIVNTLAYLAVRNTASNHRAAWNYATGFILLLLIAATYGRFRLSEYPEEPRNVRVGIVQPNLGMDEKWHPERGLERSMEVLEEATGRLPPGGVDFVMWPETAIPTYVVYEPGKPEYPHERAIQPRYRSYFRDILRLVEAPLVMGAPVYDYNADVPYNSAAVLTRDSMHVQTYDKRVLVPFGERVPYEETFGVLKKLNLGMAHWASGDRANLLHAAGVSMGVAVCFESVFPNLMREFVRKGADLLVVLTNDAWFGGSSLIYQHAEFAAFRAIENRIWVARCANTGISGIIDPWGRYLKKAGPFVEETFVGTVGRRERETLYSTAGDWIAWLCVAATAVLVIGGFARNRYR